MVGEVPPGTKAMKECQSIIDCSNSPWTSTLAIGLGEGTLRKSVHKMPWIKKELLEAHIWAHIWNTYSCTCISPVTMCTVGTYVLS